MYNRKIVTGTANGEQIKNADIVLVRMIRDDLNVTFTTGPLKYYCRYRTSNYIILCSSLLFYILVDFNIILYICRSYQLTDCDSIVYTSIYILYSCSKKTPMIILKR